MEKEEEQEQKTESSQENLSREDYVFLTQVYEKANSNEGMLLGIKKCIEMDNKLSAEERRLFAMAYGNAVSKVRKNLRYVHHEIKKLSKDEKKNEKQLAILIEIRQNLMTEIKSYCEEVQDLIDNKLYIALKDEQLEEKIFYLKLKGDYFRYLCEIIDDENLEALCDETESCYKNALEAAEENLPIANPIRLGVALNLSVFYAEIKKDKETAIEIANKAFNGAMNCLEELEKKQSKEILFLVKMLEENMKLWGKKFEEKGEASEAKEE
ncbi:MAG: 14-3-3 family protein [archaeon]|nr:14-3-3 family protein [archaeon]